jgi:type II secretory pathway pseudopilin PulG
MRLHRLALTRGEAGESLLEIIITIMIMGLAIPAVVGAVMAAVGSSTQDRRQIQAQQLLTSWSETIANANTDGNYGAYTPCPPANHYTSSPFAPANIPPGFQVSVVAVDYWDADASPPSGAFVGCAAAGAADEGVRRLQLHVVVPAGLYPSFAMDRYFIVRKPCVAC